MTDTPISWEFQRLGSYLPGTWDEPDTFLVLQQSRKAPWGALWQLKEKMQVKHESQCPGSGVYL